MIKHILSTEMLEINPHPAIVCVIRVPINRTIRSTTVNCIRVAITHVLAPLFYHFDVLPVSNVISTPFRLPTIKLASLSIIKLA